MILSNPWRSFELLETVPGHDKDNMKGLSSYRSEKSISVKMLWFIHHVQEKVFYSAQSWASAKCWIPFRARTVCMILPISVSQISWNLNTTHQLVLRWILSEQSFENFPVRGSISLKNWNFFQHLATSGCHNSAIIIGWRKFITK